jgi:dipeptidyl aminopeptidase/acylaminoacyl peptidase
MKLSRTILGLGLTLLVLNLTSQQKYEKPPKEIDDVMTAPMTPTVSLSPTRDYMILEQGVRYPSIAELSEPMLRLAGLRINPRTNGPHREPRIVALTLKKVGDAKSPEVKIAVAPDAHISGVSWSPDGKHFSFNNAAHNGIELWIGTTTTGAVAKVPGIALNTACSAGGGFGGGAGRGGFGGGRGGAGGGGQVSWIDNGKSLLVRTVVTGRGKAPALDATPTGPNVQQSLGSKGQTPTFEDLLKSQQDEVVYEYYCTAQLAVVDRATNKVTPVGKPANFATASASPDGKHFLVARVHRPYSYIHPQTAFPKDVEVWDSTGKLEYKLASVPLADNVPLEGVATGPRQWQWHPLDPATLVWAEALDGGDSHKEATQRDKVLKLAAPFKGEPTEIARTEQRYGGIQWTQSGKYALLRDNENGRRRTRTFLITDGGAPQLLWSLDGRDRYNNPGVPVMHQEESGRGVIMEKDGVIFLDGLGSSPDGDHPFLDRFDLKTHKSQRLFQSSRDAYEGVVAVMDEKGERFLTLRETPNDYPNYFLREGNNGENGGERKALTNFQDPTPQIRGIKKQLVKYKRADGVDLSFTLYLPPDYKEGTHLPAFMWAYPAEFEDPSTAGQVSGSTQRYNTYATNGRQILLALHGYAVLDNASMPVVGPSRTANDTYVDQIVSAAKAAIDKAAEMGVVDPKRVAVGGHSYGAFMTANLLANSDLFKAGVAESGAYNRTLTPFGFQNERRTFWEAKETYLRMSPFVYADKLKTPILLIHGEADDNSGTFPINSERLYQAIRGNGGTVRLVFLPAEAHGYAAKETLEHVEWETVTWLDKYLK